MTRSFRYTTAIAAAAFCLLAAPASATHVECGDTITTYTVLDSDVNCAAGQPYGLIIGANDVVLRLNGFTVRGVSDGNSAGIYTTGAPFGPRPYLSGVRIKNGSIEGFDAGVSADLDDSVLYRLTLVTGNYGFQLYGDRNQVLENTVDTVFGLTIGGDGAYVWGNDVTIRVGSGIIVGGDRYRIVYNRIDCAEGCGGYAFLTGVGHSTYALISRNTVLGNSHTGIAVAGNGAVVTLNESRTHGTGIRVSDPAAIVGRNVASDNDGVNPGSNNGTGIYSDQAGTTIRRNTANNNGWYGIQAAEGTIDGGGNVASGNGIQDCVNVQCSPSP